MYVRFRVTIACALLACTLAGCSVAPPPVVAPPVPMGWSHHTVVIDAGHGGKDPGATSCLGYQEKWVTLAVAREVARGLRRHGVRVIMTRDADKFISLGGRAWVANKNKASLFVSIHADAARNKAARGFSVYIATAASRQSTSSAGSIIRELSRTSLPSRGVKKKNYYVLRRTTGPAVLVEMGFLSNRYDAKLLRDPAFQQRIADALVTGILSSLPKRAVLA